MDHYDPSANRMPPERKPDELPPLLAYPVPGDGVADQLGGGSLGIPRGWVRTLANASAVVVIAVAFLWLLSELISVAKEQRDTIRDLGQRFERVGTETERSIRELRDGVKALDGTLRKVLERLDGFPE